jgi:hypothetical protein
MGHRPSHPHPSREGTQASLAKRQPSAESFSNIMLGPWCCSTPCCASPTTNSDARDAVMRSQPFGQSHLRKGDLSTLFTLECSKTAGGCGAELRLAGSHGWPIR